METSGWLKGLAGLVAGAALVLNLPTRLWMPAETATVEYLADTSLRTVDQSQRQFKVSLLHLNRVRSLPDIIDTVSRVIYF